MTQLPIHDLSNYGSRLIHLKRRTELHIRNGWFLVFGDLDERKSHIIWQMATWHHFLLSLQRTDAHNQYDFWGFEGQFCGIFCHLHGLWGCFTVALYWFPRSHPTQTMWKKEKLRSTRWSKSLLPQAQVLLALAVYSFMGLSGVASTIFAITSISL